MYIYIYIYPTHLTLIEFQNKLHFNFIELAQIGTVHFFHLLSLVITFLDTPSLFITLKHVKRDYVAFHHLFFSLKLQSLQLYGRILKTNSLCLISFLWVSPQSGRVVDPLETDTFYCPLSTLHCTTLHYTALHCTALHWTAMHCSSLHCTALHCTALHCTALHCTAMQC